MLGDSTGSWNHSISVSSRFDSEKFTFEDSPNCSNSGRMISKNNLEGQQNHNFQEFQT